MRKRGGEPAFRCRSEPSRATRSRRAECTSNMNYSSAPRPPCLRPPARPVPRTGQSGDIAELLGLRQGLQLLQGLVLDLTDALTGDVERATDLIQRAWVLPAEAVAQLQHATLAVGQILERLAQCLLGE